ncbi:PD-(D/E)XK nuclease family protein [Microbulbifer yueqingensis]|uniref:Probable DNA repair protein n=1 Tax=Microbulbifer yueqingensis TaxID=658219 RepID=A0A1G8ZI25_9GAMM|nr:PD-(D/E)XK nuclease family protein [Microbulbifer yueqingensis]SDK14739.1 probable DNA repair protein [Microbulbifer yueqingensis]
MLQPAFPALEILAQLPEGGLLLTPNNRLRNRCRQVYAAARGEQRNWAPPPVESLGGWLERNWFQLQQRSWRPSWQPVLNAEQRQLLWQRALDRTLDRQLLNSAQLCRDADSALSQLIQWRLLDMHQLEGEALEEALAAPLQQFALDRSEFPLFDMIAAFMGELREQDAITPDMRDLLIAQAFAGGELVTLPCIAMAGFAQVSPLARHIIDTAATVVDRHPVSRRDSLVQVAACDNLEEELYSAACWAAGLLERDQHASLGIVVNNLGQCRSQVETIFTRVLEPQLLDPAQPRYTLPFNFSAGTPLAQTPVGSGALQLLELLRDQWDYSQLRNLLFSPYWGHAPAGVQTGEDVDDAGELALRSALFRQLQKRELSQVSGDTLRYCAEQLAERLELVQPVLPRQLEAVGDWARRWQKAPAEVWAERFARVLATLGWPGPRNPDSQEYQQLGLWERVLEELAALSGFTGTLTLNQALQHLRRIASRTPFQAETRDGPVQILGVLEAGALSFDHLRLVGFGQQQWPPAPAPNPLLPVQWQKHWQMPRASAERELELARELTADLLGASKDVTVSFAREADGVEQGLSALFSDAAATAGEARMASGAHAIGSFYLQVQQSARLDTVPDPSFPPLHPDECAPVRGGSGVLKAQALCPLNAQLRYRLGAAVFNAPTLGLNPAERGKLMHEALAEFWQRCGDSSRLHNLAGEELQDTITTSVTEAIRSARKYQSHLPEGFWQLEQQRLERLVGQWLDLEKTRPAFAVAATEFQQPTEIGGLRFELRLDRLDRLPDGTAMVIDYKSRQPSIKDWQQPRLREPQLPMYALARPEARAIAFGQVRFGECSWSGTGELEQPIKGIKAVGDLEKDGPFGNWAQLVEHWQESLEMLATEYRTGHATLQFDRIKSDNDENLWPLNRWPEREQS